MNTTTHSEKTTQTPWNKGRLIGQKLPLKLKEIWAIRTRLQISRQVRELALFNLAIDSKLRGCDLVGLKVSNVSQGGRISSRTIIMQQKTHRPVQFEITEQTRDSLKSWIRAGQAQSGSVPVPQPPAQIASSFDPAIWPDRRTVGQIHWVRPNRLWDPHDAADQGDLDLQTDQEPQGCPIAAWPHQA